MRRAIFTMVLAAIAFPTGASAGANRCTQTLTPYTGSDPRVRLETFQIPWEPFEVGVRVLVPPAYDTSTRRYPVLYLLNATNADEDQYLVLTDVISFTAGLPDEQQVIVVMPDAGPGGWHADWQDGSRRWETFELQVVIPHIDRTYRTVADRTHRAVAGFSMGGLGTMAYAARRPDLFAFAASFSGSVDMFDKSPSPQAVVVATVLPNLVCHGAPGSPSGTFGVPVLEDVWLHDYNPVDIASNLRGVELFMAAGNGVPCPEHQPDPFLLMAPIEVLVHDMTKSFDAALRRASIPHVAEYTGCGTHSAKQVSDGYRLMWDQMIETFERRAPLPASFDYRTVRSRFEIRGWQFSCDARRAAEFLDVKAASPSGVTLIGSGSTAVTTPALFRPGRQVRVTGTGHDRVLRAGNDGRLRFHVNLGPANTVQQFSPQQRLDPRHTTTRVVRFWPV